MPRPERLEGVAVRTPLLRLPLGDDLYVKPESLQRTGSFKFRGAYNALSSTPRERLANGVVADSSGNHAQGVAAAAALLGLRATIVMPDNAAPVKVARTAAWGAEIVRCASSSDERQRLAAELREERGLEYIPPFDDARIIAGQGTVGLELVERSPGLRRSSSPSAAAASSRAWQRPSRRSAPTRGSSASSRSWRPMRSSRCARAVSSGGRRPT